MANAGKKIVTKFTEKFNCRVPIMGAPMANVSGGNLASATFEGGGLGFIAAGHLTDENELRNQIQIFKKRSPQAPLSLGFIVHSSMKHGFDNVAKSIEEHCPDIVQFSMPGIINEENIGNNVELAKSLNSKVMIQIGNEKEAIEAIRAKPDVIIIQGRESGGHGLRSELTSGTLPLTCRVLSLVQDLNPDIIVLAAGGIVNGKGLAAMLSLGCDGIVFGTRLWATHEAMGKNNYKNSLVNISCDDVIRTPIFDQIGNEYLNVKWPFPYDSVGAVHNSTSKQWHGKYNELSQFLSNESNRTSIDGKPIIEEQQLKAYESESSNPPTNFNSMDVLYKDDPALGCVFSGEGVGCIDKIEFASSVIIQAEVEAIAQLQSIQNIVRCE